MVKQPSAMKVIEPGLEMTVQDLPGRIIGKGIPRSGPMDLMAFSIGNILVGNSKEAEGIEIIVVPGLDGEFRFLCDTWVAITGSDVVVAVNEAEVDMWCQLFISEGGTLRITAREGQRRGLRTYLLVRGGFPQVPQYLQSKSTSMGLGGYQVRSN
jgi:allophanate hydrolase subunit 2